MASARHIWIFLLFAGSHALGQSDEYRTDRLALQLPPHAATHVDSITDYIRTHFSTEQEKTRALYTWIVHNISYSRDSLFFYRNWDGDKDSKMNQLLRRRKGVCENYAELLVHLLQKSGITAVMVHGYVKTPGASGTTGHGWAAVRNNHVWGLYDPTWDAGVTGSYRHYNSDPGEFILTHMPFDPVWQLLDQPWTHQDFRNGYAKRKDQPRFSYTDSINAYLQEDSLQQLISSARRLEQSAAGQEDTDIWHRYSRMKIHIIRQEENMQLFNNAVNDLNEAKKLFNEFVQYRNNRFKPARSDNEIKRMFNRIEDLLFSAGRQLQGIGVKAENYQYDTEGLTENLVRLQQRVEEQKQFLQRYFDCRPEEREKLLYR